MKMAFLSFTGKIIAPKRLLWINALSNYRDNEKRWKWFWFEQICKYSSIVYNFANWIVSSSRLLQMIGPLPCNQAPFQWLKDMPSHGPLRFLWSLHGLLSATLTIKSVCVQGSSALAGARPLYLVCQKLNWCLEKSISLSGRVSG